MSELAPVFIPVAGSCLAGGITWLAMRRKSSGKIATTEAGDLWRANQEFQSNLTKEVDRLRAESRACKAENDDLKARVLKLESEADSAIIIAKARVEADAIRARAALDAEALKQEAQVVKEALDRKDGHDG